jgi:NADH-quinone oxidoreductase subunit F
VDENTLSTNIKGVFAGGDFTTGPTFLIRAIASGRRAALAIQKYIEGDAGRIQILDEKTALAEDAALALEQETTEDKARIRVEIENPGERIKDFREIEKGFTEEQALREAGRCLRCDLEKEGSHL